MARFSSAFFEARNKEEDRIDQKRKDNREAFLAYRKNKAELGEDVTAEELQLYRQSLAGSDAFFLKDLGPGKMLDDLAKRTNQRSLNTRRAEEAKEVERKTNEIAMFDTWASQNLNLDATDTASAKANFMKNFVGQESIGERLWTQNQDRLMESINTGRADSAQTYVTNRLQGVNDIAAAEAIMAADALPSWKKASITQIISNREASALSTAKAKAEELVNTIEGTSLIDADDAALADRAGVIIRSAQVKLDPSSQEYKDLQAAIIATLQNRQNTGRKTDTKIREEAFSKSILGQNSQFIITFDAKGYDDQAVFDAYNYERDIAGLPRAESMADPQFQQYVQAAANRESLQYETDYAADLQAANAKADAIVERQQSVHDSLAIHFTEGTIGFNTMAMIGSNMIPTQPASVIISQLQENFGERLDAEGRDMATMNEIVDYLKGSGLYASPSDVKQLTVNENQTMRIKPGTDLQTFIDSEGEGFSEQMTNGLKALGFELDIGASEEEKQKVLDRLLAQAQEQLELDLATIVSSRGAFAEGPSGEIDSAVDRHKKKVQILISQLSTDDIKPQRVPDNKFGNEPNSGQYLAKPGSQDLIDTEGNPVIPGQIYIIENGDIKPLSASSMSTQLMTTYPITVGRGRNNFNGGQAIRNLGAEIAQVGPNGSVYGFKPAQAQAGYFNTPSNNIISIVKQMADAYRRSDPNLASMTDRQFFNMLGQPGQSQYGVTPFDFD